MTRQPARVQRTRTKGQPGMPPGSVYVGRGSRWGNPARIAVARNQDRRQVGWSVYDPATHRYGPAHRDETAARAEAAAHFTTYLADRPELVAAVRSKLRGRDLACWCPLPEPGQPDHCHAAVLLEIANQPEGSAR